MRTRIPTGLAAVLLALALVFFGTADRAVAEDPPAPPGTPTASSSAGTPKVGPLFADGLGQDHGCTASVIASPTHDLIITAAHCLDGTAQGWQFAPGYDRGRTPFGVWTVLHAYLAPGWLKDQDPRQDVAILQLAPRTVRGRRVEIQNAVGANLLGSAPKRDTLITDIVYNAGSGDRPITCTTRSYLTSGYPTFNCGGYVGGSSGSPWLSGVPGSRLHVVRGVIGGLNQGGCYDYTSYSSPFGADVAKLYLRAVTRQHPDSAPNAGSDGC